MDMALDKYLNTIDEHLKPISVSERVDIIKEIKSQILEMEDSEGLTPKEIINRLGDPKEMAKAYLGDLISQSPGLNRSKVLTIIAFYGMTGISGMFVIPFLGILSPVLKFCGVLVPIAGMIKLIGYIFHFNIPFVVMMIGSIELNPIIGFIVSILAGIGLYKLGCVSWKSLLKYIHNVSNRKNELFSNTNL